MTQASDDDWWSGVRAALAVGQQLAQSVEQFNVACEHIVSLLRDASALLAAGSHATAAFLAITALEETAKVHVGTYRRGAAPAPAERTLCIVMMKSIGSHLARPLQWGQDCKRRSARTA